MNDDYTITGSGWLICGDKRINLAAVDYYEARPDRVLLHLVGQTVQVDCSNAVRIEGTTATLDFSRKGEDARAKVMSLLAALDAYFNPPAEQK